MITAVLDTNVIVSGILKPESVPGKIFRRGLQKEFQLVTSPHLWSELTRVLSYQKIVYELKKTWSENDLHVFLRESKKLIEFVIHDPPATKWVPQDPDDDFVIACALTAGSEYVVSGDQHLLSLNSVNGVRIVTPATFLPIINKSGSPLSADLL